MTQQEVYQSLHFAVLHQYQGDCKPLLTSCLVLKMIRSEFQEGTILGMAYS